MDREERELLWFERQTLFAFSAFGGGCKLQAGLFCLGLLLVGDRGRSRESLRSTEQAKVPSRNKLVASLSCLSPCTCHFKVSDL